MIDLILGKLGLSEFIADMESETAGQSRRRFVRHPGLQAEVQVGGGTYSVRDWSLGGVFFDTPPDSRLIVGDDLNVQMRFRLPHETVDIVQKAKVVRSAGRGIAAEFAPLSVEARRRFERVIDGFHAQTFVESQVA